ncbi:MAG: 4-carboxymuconolactone decarboxylase [Spirochaetes bacterium DG_61]|nr:MAG: 4-carboxymuconolactone decarboxylase [Spirochaetes bacterium DG_61]
MAENPMDVIRDLDEQLHSLIAENRDFCFEGGALSKKTKYLIALALDASHGAIEGVKALALEAKKNGASKDEIMEALRVAHFISGVGCIYVAARALKEIF